MISDISLMYSYMKIVFTNYWLNLLHLCFVMPRTIRSDRLIRSTTVRRLVDSSDPSTSFYIANSTGRIWTTQCMARRRSGFSASSIVLEDSARKRSTADCEKELSISLTIAVLSVDWIRSLLTRSIVPVILAGLRKEDFNSLITD